jgi:hypothetical protein
MKSILKGMLVIGVMLVLAACGTSLQPTSETLESQNATVTEGVLNLNFAFGVPSAKIIVGPAQGRVEVFGLTGIPDGSVYTGIKAINWTSGTGDDAIQLEVTQATDFDVTINTGTSNAAVQAKWIIPAGTTTTITPSLNLATGPGMKNVQVDLESFTRNVNFDLVGRMGAGATDFKGNLQFKQGSQSATAKVDFRFSGVREDKAELLVDNEARRLNLTLSPSLMSELVTKIVSDDPSDFARVNFRPTANAGGSKIGFELTSSAPQVTLNHTVRGGAGPDEAKLSLTTLNPASVTSGVNMDFGQGNDKLELKYDGLPSNQNVFTGPINLGGGDDEAKLEFRGLTNYAFSLDCGDGTDKATGFPALVTNCELN